LNQYIICLKLQAILTKQYKGAKKMKQPRTPLKYEYSSLMAQYNMLKSAKGNVNLTDLRTFYPRASWTELRFAVSITDNLTLNEKTHEIEVIE